MEEVKMENVQVENKEAGMPFSYTAKYLGRFVVFQILMLISIAFIGACVYVGIIVMNHTTETAFTDDAITILALLVAVAIATALVGGIGEFFTKRKLAVVNEELRKVWSAEKKKLIASGANAIANAVLKDGILKDSANAANSIYQTIQSFKQRKAIIRGLNIELGRAGVENAEERGKGAFASYVISTILVFVVMLVGVAIIVFKASGLPEAEVADFAVNYGAFVLAGGLATALIDLIVFTKYLNDAKNEFQARA
jgi:ABC-type multidrug transport system fused ATPase/permease subunit